MGECSDNLYHHYSLTKHYEHNINLKLLKMTAESLKWFKLKFIFEQR